MLYHFHLPHYFATKVKKEIEHLYASVAIGNLAQAIITVFEPIFLFTVVGFSIEQVLLFFGSVYAIYVVLIPFGAKIASRFGYAHGIFFSIPFLILYWFFLMGAKDSSLMLYLAPVLFAAHKALFWPSFHASMARFANREQRGREFSVMYAIMNVMLILGPVIGGVLGALFGLNAVLWVAAIVYFCSAIPLFWTQEVFVPKLYKYHDTWELYKKNWARFIGYFGFGEEFLMFTIWPIFIYLIVRNFQNLGLLVTVATLIASVMGLYIGMYIDGHSKRSVLRFGALGYIVSWVFRIFVGSSLGVFIADAMYRTSNSMVFVPVSALTYERAESTHILPYVVGFEQALALGKFLAAVVAFIVFALTGSFIAVFVVAALFALFYWLV